MNTLINNTDLELMSQFESFIRQQKRARQANFKAQWDSIILSTTTKQYFKWHNDYFKGDLSYRHLAETMRQSTKSLGIRAKCDQLLNDLTTEGLI